MKPKGTVMPTPRKLTTNVLLGRPILVCLLSASSSQTVLFR